MAKSNLKMVDRIKCAWLNQTQCEIKRAWLNQTLKRWIGLNKHGQIKPRKDRIKRAWPNQTLCEI